MIRKLSESFGVLAVLGAAILLGGGCTPAERNFASGGAGGQGGGGCPAGFAECDGDPSTVCETDTSTSLEHCGICDKACAPVLDANIACVAGTCSITSCNNGLENCDNFYDNGCETNPITSFDHCGKCGNSCETPNAITACVAGVCQIAQCVMPNLDCDKDPKTACEVNPATNVDNCGGCGMACTGPNAMMACVDSACTIAACNANFSDCNMVLVDGCETDLLSDPHHCTACGKSCGGGLCNAGVCNPPIIVGKSPFVPGEIAILKDTLYIGSRAQTGEVAQVALAGGMPTVLAGSSVGPINAMAVTLSGIFIGGNQGTMRMGLDGLSPFNYGAGTCRGISLDISTVYWTQNGSIRMGPVAGGGNNNFLNGLNGPYGLALDNNVVFWGLQDGTVWSSPTGLPTPTKLASGPLTATNLVPEAVNIYWSSSTGIHWAPRIGGASNTLAMTTNTVRAIATDATHVYWTDEMAGLVQRVLKDGSGMPEVLALDQALPWGVAVDAQFVYWANGGTNEILKLAK